MSRTVALRLYGLVVAAALGAAATQLFLYSMEQDTAFETLLTDVAGWARERPVAGALMLAGIGVGLVALGSAWTILRSKRTTTMRIRKDEGGRSTVDLSSLASSLQRTLRQTVHPQVVVGTARRGVEVRAPIRSAVRPLEFVEELGSAMPEEFENRGLTGVRYRVTTGRQTKRRVR